MQITIQYAWWWIPAAITLAGLFWAFFVYDDGGGFLGGIGNMFAAMAVLAVSCIAWIIAGALK
jgi:hypothetical protein